MKIRNIFIIFIVSGFWHGANWTFIIWGALNAIYFLPLLLLKKNRINRDTVAQDRYLPSLKEVAQMALTFILVVFSWIFFRAVSITHAHSYLTEIFSKSFFSMPEIVPKTLFILLFVFFILEWMGRKQKYALGALEYKWKLPFRWSIYVILFFSIFIFSSYKSQFIYFQF
jgi:hypothetical protein